MESNLHLNKDPLDGYPQTVSEKLRRKILLAANIFPGIIGSMYEGNRGKLTGQKARSIGQTERKTNRKVNWQTEKEGD